MAKSSKKHGTTKNLPLSPLEIAFGHYEEGNVVAARAKALAFAKQAPKEPSTEEALVAKLWWPSPPPLPPPPREAVALALAARTKSPLWAYAYALLCLAVAAFLGLLPLLRN